ncbi:hypothetical protein [Prevotella sp. OH937_COT-195]|uniref:hypothetical protein n=1 Tax=Prevotella sp. OH937_COT-195 TaxID=2491051 RepID=UPI000F6514F0|nr:hypothetical protein [Prevotella sp. OH937_COT-195]RRC99047.1 hypothetical protein EII32_08420 [Prevotella sp. OH937_COT-195]
MQTLKNIIRVVLWLLTVAAFSVMVSGYFIKPSVTGFVAMWVFAILFAVSVFASLPISEKESLGFDDAANDNINLLGS